MSFFDTSYTLRRYAAGSRSVTDGSWVPGGYTESTVLLDVQPISGSALAALPEGRREKANIKGYSNIALYTVDMTGLDNNPDVIVYEGDEYEVVVSKRWKTLLPHYYFEAVKK